MHSERRELRSTEPADAIRIFLARNATDPGLEAVVVANDDGALLGGVGVGDLAGLAAVGSSLVNMRSDDERRRACSERGLERDELHVVRLGVGPRSYVITSRGAPLAAAGRLGAALGRILAA